MLAIYKRELKSYFRSFIGFLFIAVTLFFLGLYFSVYNLMNGYPYFAYVVSSVTFLFMLTVPILTMRILAEEKRSKTDQLILTAMVGSLDGKTVLRASAQGAISEPIALAESVAAMLLAQGAQALLRSDAAR